MALTRLQIFQHVLDLAQLDSTEFYLAKCRLWYKISVEKLALRKDFPFYNKKADYSFVANQTAYTLPTDYLRPDACFHVDQNGVQGDEITIREPYQFDPYVTNADGLPFCSMIDADGGNIVFNSASSNPSGKKYRFRYFRKPTDYSLTNSDDGVVPDFEDSDVLIQNMLAIAYEREDDERQNTKKAEAEQASIGHQRNMYNADSSSTLDLSRENFRGRRGFGRRSSSWDK